MKTTLIASVVIALFISSAIADGLPITEAYGSKWACDAYKAAGIDGVYKAVGPRASDDATLITADRFIQPGVFCTISGSVNSLVESCKWIDHGVDRSYVNDSEFKRISRNTIWFAEARFGTDYRRCK